MPSHLRNGKDLSFEQLRAAERDAERRRQQQRVAKIVARQSAIEPLSPSDYLGEYDQLPSVGNPNSTSYSLSAVGQTSAVGESSVVEQHAVYPSSVVEQNHIVDPNVAPCDPPSGGYSFSPAALERLRRSREQQFDAHGSRRNRPARDGASLPARPGYSALGSFLPGSVHGNRIEPFNACPPPSGETALCGLAQGSPASIDGRVYDADTDSPLSPHERIPKKGNVDRPLTLQPGGPQGQGNGQWLLFVNAKETNNYRLMRIALNQAMSTQDTIKSLFGTEQMMSVSDGWLARDELARLEHSLQIPPQPMAEPPTARLQSQLNMPADRPPSTYQARMPPPEHQVHRAPAVQQQHQQLQLPPPPPPPPPPLTTAEAPRQASELMAPPPVPGQMIPGTGRRPEIHQPAAQRPYPPPPYPEEEGYYAQDPYDPQQQHLRHAHPQWAPYQANGDQASRPYPRNRRRIDPMTRMLQVGNFFMRAERVMNRMQRRRTRGGRNNRMPPLAQLPPGNPQ
ncbi:hypothetical protein PCASD_19103 [Puccinia coronata f. sp. avenae]|uniref:Uncharacterized protein n=1 Tax=Puccinia coronata f. sp. avenae TaxID=200324 RepID=A0A2N5U1E4_9BASI|nr:hypothetical protein PCASD_19103 [Puccinia coronata f. sp. avenae]